MVNYIRKIRKKVENKKGQQLVELIVILPIIILCIGIIITSGQLIFAKMACQLAAFEGARRAVVISNYTTAKNTAITRSKELMKTAIGVNQSSIKTNFGASSASWKKPNILTYSVSADVKTLFPVIGPGFKFQDTTTVTGSIALMIERN